MYSLLLIVTFHILLIYYLVIPIINFFRAKTHKKHLVIRIGPNALSYAGPVAIKVIYGHGAKCTKDFFYYTLSGSHFHLADVPDMTQHIVKTFDKRFTSPLPKGQVLDPKDLTIDYRMWMNLEDLRFLDQRSDIITSEAKDRALKKVHFRECLYTNAWVTSNLVWAYDWNKTLARVSKLVSSTYRQKWKLSEDWGGIVYNRATTRSKRLEWGEIVAEVTNVMLLLLKNLHCLKRLREEIVGVLDQDEVIVPYGKVKHLPYLRACFDESMRMFPPVFLHIPCRTPLEGTAAVRGEFVAGETSVGISTYVVHRNEAISLDPEAYKPERRLGETGGIYSRILLLSTRGYIGRNISYLEQTVLQASLPVSRERTNLTSGPMLVKVWKRADEMCADI
ncbi:cytochrome P450 [Aspergillus alliaceus]|uniref:Cytochrome P450 n=1 Tax=Petromyces alliaceus TaxID=209559 RepID=A0A5N7BX79_PETAA|nr:cytochrome P450 [Aspergillus alliaceus]